MKTKTKHTLFFIGVGLAVTVISFIIARSDRGMNAVGGEYFVPLIFLGLWKLDMMLIDVFAPKDTGRKEYKKCPSFSKK